MKIGFVIDDTLDKPDGVQQYVLTLGSWLSTQGHEVHYLAGQSARTDIANVHSLSQNMHVRFNQNRLSIPRSSNKEAIKQLLEQEQFDVLHIQMPYSPLMAGRIVKLAQQQTAIVGTFHIIPFSSLERLGTVLLKLWQWRNLRRFDHIVSVSKPAQRFAQRAMGLRSEVIPNVVNLSLYQTGKKLAKYDDGKMNIVFLGRLVERKGALELLKAISLLHDKKQLDNVRVLMCGKGPLEKELKTFVQDHHLSNHVRFEGFIDETDKPDYLASANIAVFPSLGGESFGIVLIEAMAAGSQTVLGGNNAGYRSVLGNNSNQIINSKDAGEFAKQLHHFIVSSQARHKTASWQRKHVQRYDVVVVGKQLEEVYNSAIAKRSR